MKLFIFLLTALVLTFSQAAYSGEVLLRPHVKSITLTLGNQTYVIQRNQDPTITITSLYTNTTVGKLQPIHLAPGVETIGEVEVLDYLQRMQTDDSIILIDTRPKSWFDRIRIPGAVDVPPATFENELTATETLEKLFNVKTNANGELDFSQAKTIVAYCNGHFCGYTPDAIKHADYSLLKLGYPPEKIKYYRGGMQAWTSVGLTVIGEEAFN
ncbi:rhodanese-like domain-containing protein [Thiomicrorhabdus sp. zzn3]|uniref:rhodanese-like domain-containing protein n=1 Tax=Thiomicrorhabdus sp. zzn3 TaxID=3039775 RepID=UPI0024371FDF|nr:rhodanese-like domain-containing protein [Thiomicrorhabdus sp. zzn3]MDG6777490.1 rhodanese-like domain-containing protein [Thiomicrorhabdus sp. zzn3]